MSASAVSLVDLLARRRDVVWARRLPDGRVELHLRTGRIEYREAAK